MFSSFRIIMVLVIGIAFPNATYAETNTAKSKRHFSTLIESQAHKGAVRQLLYRSATLRNGLEYFRSLSESKYQSVGARPTVRNRIVLSDHRDRLTEKQFIQHFDTVISDDLRGVRLEDMMLVKFIEKLSGRAGKKSVMPQV